MSVSRRSFLASAAGATAAQTTVPKGRPNILLLLADDHRWDALGCMGNTVVQTPQLDRLSQNGVTFENHFCTTAICCASRASIFTGQYASVHRIEDFARPLDATQTSQIYPVLMRRAGYHTGFIGKFGVGNTMPSGEFDYWKGFKGQGAYFPAGPNGPHLTHIMRDQAVEFLEQAPRDRPFCLSVSFKAPHVQDEDPRQYLPSADTLALYEGQTIPLPRGADATDIRRFPLAIQRSENRRRWAVRFGTPDLYQASMKGYYRLVSGIDSALGAIRQTLERLHLAENTVIVYSADHGIFLGEHGMAGKWYAHEESIRVPLIVHDPRAAAAERGVRRQAMTLNMDIPATLLDFAGIAPPVTYQGRSVRPLFAKDDAAFRSHWYYEHRFTNQGWIPASEGIRTRGWKYARYTDDASPFEEMYDLRRDPHETKNLVGNGTYEKQKRALSRYTSAWNQSLKGWKGEMAWKEPVDPARLAEDDLM